MSQIIRVLVLLGGLTVTGTLGLYFIEDDYRLIDALYMTVITLSTVGFGEVKPLSDGGRVFLIIFLVFGLGVFLVSVAEMGEFVLRNRWLDRKRKDSALDGLKGHFIVCGFGRMGETICQELRDRNRSIVVIEQDEERAEVCRSRGWHWLVGDATDDAVLEEAGVARAAGLAAVLPTDADNLFVVFSARILRPDLRILARATDRKQSEKIRKAGADRVVSPYHAAGAKIAQMLSNPNVEDFIEVFRGGTSDLDLVEIHVDAQSRYRGQTLAQTGFSALGLMVVGVRRSTGEMVLPPAGTTRVDEGDTLFVLGSSKSVELACARV